MQNPWELQLDALGEYIRAQRRHANLSLRELAALTQLSNAYLSQLERGLHEPSVRVLRSLAGALDVSRRDACSPRRACSEDERPVDARVESGRDRGGHPRRPAPRPTSRRRRCSPCTGPWLTDHEPRHRPRPWLAQYDPRVPATFEPAVPHGVELFERGARERPDDARVPLLRHARSHREADAGTRDALAAALRDELGLRPGDRVALMLQNVPQLADRRPRGLARRRHRDARSTR